MFSYISVQDHFELREEIVMTETPPLTLRQQEVLEFINEQITKMGYPPTIREIGEHLGIRSTNGVADHLKALKRKGYLQQRDMKSRTLTPIREKVAQALDTAVRVVFPGGGRGVAVPILGRVAAGEPILAEEMSEGTLVVDEVLVGKERKLFALKVVGNSMIDAGILNGDYIFVRKRADADPGEIVVVVIDNEATVKRYFPEGDRIRLQPENRAMQPIFVQRQDFKQIQIIGSVVGVYRKLPE
jgi:repressor LexA